MVANGSYSSFSLTKNVRVVAQNQYGATVSGSPRFTAGWIEGFVFPNASVNADGSGTITFKGNRILNGPVPGQEFRVFRSSGKVTVWGNDFRDPHFTDGTAVDYAVQLYGTSGARVCHNYTYGHWHQPISFKEGNRDYTIAYNTIEGCSTGSCIFVAQNDNSNGLGHDTGLIQVHHNRVQRAVNSSGGTLYRARNPIRVGYMRNADLRIHDNLLIGSFPNGSLIWGSGTGRITYTNNAVYARANGTVDSISACIVRTGSGYTITSDRLQCYDAPVLSGGGVTMTNTTTGTRNVTLTPGPNPRFDPDLALLGSPTPTPQPPTAAFSWSPQNPASPPVLVTFDGSASTCPASPCTYTYDHAGTPFPNDDTSTPTATFEYQATGAKTVRLTVTDARGATAQITQSFTVSSAPTVVAANPLGLIVW